MYFGTREKVTFIVGYSVLALAFFLFTPWWMAAAVLAMLVPVYMQLHRLSSNGGRKAKRPAPKN